jgi:hypothetical protein
MSSCKILAQNTLYPGCAKKILTSIVLPPFQGIRCTRIPKQSLIEQIEQLKFDYIV